MEKSFFQKYKIWIFIGIFFFIFVFGSSFWGKFKKTVILQVWGSELTQDQFSILAENVKSTSRNPVKLIYTEFESEDYEEKLLESFIHAESPDIFLMNNEQIGKFRKLISPYDLENANYNINNLRKDYPTIIEQEAVLDNMAYLLPVSIDSLVLYYNRNVFDSLSVSNPPSTWSDILKLIPNLRQLDAYNRIIRSPIGLGTGNSINNSADLLALIIMQLNGKIINTSEQRVAITEGARVGDDYINASEEALKFYCQFAKSNNQYYSWNDSFNNDLEAFASNKLTMYFGYLSDKEKIIQKNSDLNFGISEMVQRDKDNIVNFGKFFGFTVSSQTKNANTAWEAIRLLLDPANMKSLIKNDKIPPANRELISEYYNNPDLAVFAKQALNSKSYYHPTEKVKDAFIQAIEEVNKTQDYKDAISKLGQDLTNLMYNN